MRKMALFVLSSIISFSAFSQVGYGFQGGVNFANVDFQYNNAPSTDYRTSLNIGFITDFPVTEDVHIRPELFLTGKGYHYSTTVLGTQVTRTSKPVYLEIPVLIHLRGDLGPGALFGEVGPYIADGVAGRYHRESALNTEDNEITYGTNPHHDQYQKTDYGIRAGAGISIDPGLSLSVDYDLGLKNVAPSGASDEATYTRTLSINIGFFVQ